MVARTPPKQKKIAAPLNPILLRETVKKVDQCMARLQELQYIVAGGTKVISGKSLSPRSTRCYLKTSLRCKQESARIKNAAPRKSPVGKFAGSKGGEWRRMSLPAMLVGETVGEILQASQFAREIVSVTKKASMDDPKTPVSQGRRQRPQPENSELRSRRNREKQVRLQTNRGECEKAPRARSRINFKVVSPKKTELSKENYNYYHLSANRVSPRNRPWARKTVMFPNPLFTPSRQRKIISPAKTREMTPHKFLIKSPAAAAAAAAAPAPAPGSGSKRSPPIKIRNHLTVSSISPTRAAATGLGKKHQSPPHKVLSAAAKFRRSFSPSRLANRLVSPLKNRKSVEKTSEGLKMMSGLKQRPTTSSPLVRMMPRLSVERISTSVSTSP